MGVILLYPRKNIKLILNYVVGPLVFCILLFSIYKQVQQQADWEQSLAHIFSSFNGVSAWQLLLVFGLMFINWGIEARKWQLALRHSVKVSFIASLRAIFSGTTFAFFTPNRMGEYMGRIIHIEEGKRISSITLTIVCSIAQLLITMIAGCIGLLFIRSHISVVYGVNIIFWINLLLYVIAVCSLVLTLFYFRLSWLVKWIERIPRTGRWMAYIKVVDGFNATILLRILSLSGVRYLVFVIQYYLLFRVFGVEIGWWQTFWSVSAVFLVIAIVPSIAVLTELGIRWKASMEIIQLYSANSAGILAGSLAAWIINLVIPALIGSIMILG